MTWGDLGLFSLSPLRVFFPLLADVDVVLEVDGLVILRARGLRAAFLSFAAVVAVLGIDALFLSPSALG